MSLWIIEPRDPLIVRDGRPFDAAPGARAVSLPFPQPGTIAGAVRTRAVVCAQGAFPDNDAAVIKQVKNIAVRGPLPVEIEGGTGLVQSRLLAPAPADALLLSPLEGDVLPRRKQLAPVQTPAEAWTDLQQTTIVGLLKPDKSPSKPFNRAPRFWHWDEFLCWLKHPQAEEVVAPDSLGHGGPPNETRSHVSIDDQTLTNREGAIFQTRGLRFTLNDKHKRLGLAVYVSDMPSDFRLEPGIAPLGGERRLMFWHRGEIIEKNEPQTWPQCPASLRAAIVERGACRLILLTPGAFVEGWTPHWLCKENGLEAQVIASALGRAQTISGWDFDINKPKKSRRLVPAGSVFWLRFDENSSAEQRESWVDAMWLNTVSDDSQDRRDGFGLAALGVWDGQIPAMRFGDEEIDGGESETVKEIATP